MLFASYGRKAETEADDEGIQLAVKAGYNPNAMIASLLYKKHPAQLKFVLIDPKKVELSLYSGLLKHHLLKIEGIDDPVVTKSEDAVRLLEALVVLYFRRSGVPMPNRTEYLSVHGDAQRKRSVGDFRHRVEVISRGDLGFD